MAGRGSALYVARKTFWAGSILVKAGDIIVAGHPLLERHADAFAPVVPRFTVPREPKAAAARSETGTARGETRGGH